MIMRLRSRSSLLAVTTLVLACSSDRENAVKKTLAFAQEAPYTIATPAERSNGFLFSIKDSAVSSYNKVFQYFEPKDTTRATVYGTLPGNLLFLLPITRLDNLTSKQLPVDTVQVVAVFSRPESKMFEKALIDLIPSSDTVSPTVYQQLEFQRFLSRARQGLQDTDTGFFWVTAGPRIVRFVTARHLRDSVAQKLAADSLLNDFSRLIHQASFSRLEVTRYPIAPSYNLDGGGNVTGILDPGPGGWPRAPLGYTDVHVTCEARNGEEAVSEISYIILRKLTQREKEKVLCLWSADGAQKWNDIKPKTFRVRIIGKAGRDSVVGEWTEVRAR